MCSRALVLKERRIMRRVNGDAHIAERLMPAMWAPADVDGISWEMPLEGDPNSSRIRRRSNHNNRKCYTVGSVESRWKRIQNFADSVEQRQDGNVLINRNYVGYWQT